MSKESLPFDVDKFYLGILCPHNHDWQHTGRSLRSLRTKICLECGRVNAQKYRRQHPDKADASVKRYREKNPEVQERSIRKRRASGQSAQATRRWRRNHPEYKAIHAERERLRRFKKRASRLVSYTPEQVRGRFAQFDNCCAYCGCRHNLTVDHFIPIASGGADCLGNIVPACFSCNSSKQDSDAFEWYQKQRFYSQQRWLKMLSVLGKDDHRQMPLF